MRILTMTHCQTQDIEMDAVITLAVQKEEVLGHDEHGVVSFILLNARRDNRNEMRVNTHQNQARQQCHWNRLT